MEAKKSLRADLNRKSALFFSVGLLVAMCCVLMAFEWKQQENLGIVISCNFDPFNDIVDVPVTEIRPPEPPAPKAPVLVEAPEEEEVPDIPLILNVESEPLAELPAIDVSNAIEVEEVEEIFIAPEESATPVGGFGAFYKYLGDNIRYPNFARRIQTEGKVYVEFVIAKDGSITDAKVLTGIGAGCDEEALRVIKSAPAWNPGKQRGKPVKQRMVVPVTFRFGH